jgi:hypothetical protein
MKAVIIILSVAVFAFVIFSLIKNRQKKVTPDGKTGTGGTPKDTKQKQ